MKPSGQPRPLERQSVMAKQVRLALDSAETTGTMVRRSSAALGLTQYSPLEGNVAASAVGMGRPPRAGRQPSGRGQVPHDRLPPGPSIPAPRQVLRALAVMSRPNQP